jgi:hypothetical protein
MSHSANPQYENIRYQGDIYFIRGKVSVQ